MANEPKKVRQRRSMLQIPGVQTILSSLLCIVLGLLVGFVVLLLIDHGVSERRATSTPLTRFWLSSRTSGSMSAAPRR